MTTDSVKCNRKLCQNRSLETKNAILVAGIQLFSEHGFHKVNTKDIAKAANISVGSFYGYYEDKRHLFIDLVNTYKQELANAVRCEKTADSGCSTYSQEDVINYFVTKKLIVAEKYPLAFHHELNHMKYRDPEVAKVFEAYYKMEIDTFEKSLENHSQCIRITNFRAAAEVIYQVSDAMINAYLSCEDITYREYLILQYKQMVQRYLFE